MDIVVLSSRIVGYCLLVLSSVFELHCRVLSSRYLSFSEKIIDNLGVKHETSIYRISYI